YELFYKEKVNNLIFLSFGTGIGGGVINDSKLVRGEGAAGELGHILISNDLNIDECTCGLTGCFESLASAKQWSTAVEQLPGTNLSKGSDLFNKNLLLTELQIEKRDEFISHISRGLISLYEIFDNQVFVIGGSFTDDQNDLVEILNERIAKESKFQLEWRSFPEIYIAQLKSDAGIIGASFLVQ
ncbi:MAG: ROK family protein, partial [Actinomycetota bacterium]|nr:ROK family protein [Actinomycetota bacterium]